MSLKLTAYFAERQRSGPQFLAESMLNLFADRRVATSVMLRGISGFGHQRIIRTDESLTLSEDPSVAVAAVDSPHTIGGLVDDVVGMTSSGLITVERARLLDGAVSTVPLPDRSTAGDAVKLTIYVGRNRRVNNTAAYKAVCEVLHRNGFAGAWVFLGVDGTAHGERRRASFIGRNVDVPLMIIAVGSAEQVQQVAPALNGLLSRPLMTVERARLCKSGRLLAPPPDLPEVDDAGRPLWQKLMVFTSEATRHGGMPIHRALVRRLWQSGAAGGATVVRGIWGFRSPQDPHGDKLIQFGRQVPVMTVIVDRPSRIARSFAIVDELTGSHGVVTCEMVPALLTIDGDGQHGSTVLADFRY